MKTVLPHKMVSKPGLVSHSREVIIQLSRCATSHGLCMLNPDRLSGEKPTFALSLRSQDANVLTMLRRGARVARGRRRQGADPGGLQPCDVRADRGRQRRHPPGRPPEAKAAAIAAGGKTVCPPTMTLTIGQAG